MHSYRILLHVSNCKRWELAKHPNQRKTKLAYHRLYDNSRLMNLYLEYLQVGRMAKYDHRLKLRQLIRTDLGSPIRDSF